MTSEHQPLDGSRSLTILGNDLLYQICAMMSEIDQEGMYEGYKSQKSLLALSGMSRSLRDLAMPFLFHEIVIRDPNYPQEGWEIFSNKLTKLNEDTSIHRYIRSLALPIKDHVADGSQPPSGLPRLLAQILMHLPKLRSFRLEIPPSCINFWISEMTTFDINLPLVDNLVIDPCCEFMVPICPNVSTIEISSSRHKWDKTASIRMALIAAKLTDLQITGSWDEEVAETLLSFPNGIRKLGTVRPGWHVSTESVIKKLGQLSNLQSLTVAGAGHLRVGFSPPRCGNAYFGPNGAAFAKSISQQRKSAEEKVVGMVDTAFGEKSQLKSLQFFGGSLFEKMPRSGETEGVGIGVGNWVRTKAR